MPILQLLVSLDEGQSCEKVEANSPSSRLCLCLCLAVCVSCCKPTVSTFSQLYPLPRKTKSVKCHKLELPDSSPIRFEYCLSFSFVLHVLHLPVNPFLRINIPPTCTPAHESRHRNTTRLSWQLFFFKDIFALI